MSTPAFFSLGGMIFPSSSGEAWRALHPRTDADLERLLGSEAEARTTFSLEELDDPYFSLLQPKPPEVGLGMAGDGDG